MPKRRVRSLKATYTADEKSESFGFLEFFAGAGLAAQGLRNLFQPVWANDIDPKKSAVYEVNHGGGHFHLGSVTDVKPTDLPSAVMSWASFPCQDLSLAGNMNGINAERSGLVWDWLRIMQGLSHKPPVLVAENVVGLVSGEGGAPYRQLHRQLQSLGYRSGAMLLDGANWVPQSRPRIFVVAVLNKLVIPENLVWFGPTWAHPANVVKASNGLEDFIFWSLPEPAPSKIRLVDIVEFDAPVDSPEKSKRNVNMIPKAHLDELMKRVQLDGRYVAPGYKRTRHGQQVLELRFDGIGGCLRTPKGGSSRQLLVLALDGKLVTRLMTVRETARLMGVPESFKIPGSYNDGYKAMGDAVVVPAVHHLGKHLLRPLSEAARAQGLGV